MKVSLQSAALGEKYNETMKVLREEQGGRLFLSTLASHLHLQTKHEMTNIKRTRFHSGSQEMRDDCGFLRKSLRREIMADCPNVVAGPGPAQG